MFADLHGTQTRPTAGRILERSVQQMTSVHRPPGGILPLVAHHFILAVVVNSELRPFELLSGYLDGTEPYKVASPRS